MSPAYQWPATAGELAREQERLASLRPPPWSPAGLFRAAGVAFVASRRAPGRGARGEPAWAAAALVEIGAGPPRTIAVATVSGTAAAPFEPGLLALREGPLLEAAARALPEPPEVLVLHAAGRDHPRGAGLALMLGAALDLPSSGVTDRPLVASGPQPALAAGATSPLALAGEVVAAWVRTRAGGRPVVAHAAWRTSPEVAAKVVLAAAGRFGMPEPLRRAREEARRARSAVTDVARRER